MILFMNLLLILFVTTLTSTIFATLYPKDTLTRQTKTLDGIWRFRIASISDPEIGFRQKWYLAPFIETGSFHYMPVPSSYNDITQEKSIRDHIGWAWYETQFYLPNQWNKDHTFFLRFSSVNFYAVIYINGIKLGTHTGGHLPFEFDVSSSVHRNQTNLLVVAVNNTLSADTLPQGSIAWKTKPPHYEFRPNFDFFNYAGIHRSVHLVALPLNHISGYTFETSIDPSGVGIINYNLFIRNDKPQLKYVVEVFNRERTKKLGSGEGISGKITILPDDLNLWWPYGLHPDPGYLYQVDIFLKNEEILDHYPTHVGIRVVQVNGSNLILNGKQIYLTGFGKHEDSNIRGRGLDFTLLVKDFNLIKWIGANSFRTSHYPYSEELMDMADKLGIIIIDECPAVALSAFNQKLLSQHLRVIEEMILRDRNHPSVLIWSIANEPQSFKPEADKYFEKVVNLTKSLDSTRPVSVAINANVDKDYVAKHLDLLMINRYYGWYESPGYTQVIKGNLYDDMMSWYKKHGKPILISEYGADTIPGLHQDPPYVFAEDYQTELMIEYFHAFDLLRHKGFFVGEMIWNFADFMTNQEITRVGGNRKGIFTRERQPKVSAKVLRCRYRKLNNLTIDDNLYCPAIII